MPLSSPSLLRSVPLAALVLAGCAQPLACRAPDVETFTAEGVENALCDISFTRCEDDSDIEVSCSNDTFSGDYACTWNNLKLTMAPWGAPTTGTFTSPDICTRDVDAMVDEINAKTPLDIDVE